jgi:hypothetical protein
MFPKKGNDFPSRSSADRSPVAFARAISDALRAELGNTHRAIKIIMLWTGASEKTAKNWLEGRVGPRGHYLIRLIRESSNVLDLVVAAARAPTSGEVGDAEGGKQPGEVMKPAWSQQGAHLSSVRSSNYLHPANSSPCVPANVPRIVPINVPMAISSLPELNNRQRWFLAEMTNKTRVRHTDIASCWSVSTKTAKRDIAVLRTRDLIAFVGPKKTGRYVLRLLLEADGA